MRALRPIAALAALALAANLSAQPRTASSATSLSPAADQAEKVRRAIQSDLADTFPEAQIRVTLAEGRARLYIDVRAPGMGETAAKDVLDTVRSLATTDVQLHAPGSVVSDDSVFTVRTESRTLARREADFRTGRGPLSTRAPAIPVPPVRAAAGAKRAGPSVSKAPSEPVDELAETAPAASPPARLAAGRPRKPRAAGKRGPKEIADEEQAALEREKRDIAALGGSKSKYARPWEKMNVAEPPPPPPKEYVPPMVLADVIDLPTARTAPKQRVLASLRTSWRELGAHSYSNLTGASERIEELDFRVGLTRRLEAKIRPVFTDIDLSPASPGMFGGLSSSQGAAAFGLRYRLPWQESLYSLAVGVDASIIRNGDRQFLLPDDFERLRGMYLALSHPGGAEASWHLALAWSPLDVPDGSPASSLWQLGAGVDHHLSQRLRLLAELIWKSLDNSTVGLYGKSADPDYLAGNLGLRASFRFATLDLFARRIVSDDSSEYGLALHTEL